MVYFGPNLLTISLKRRDRHNYQFKLLKV